MAAEELRALAEEVLNTEELGCRGCVEDPVATGLSQEDLDLNLREGIAYHGRINFIRELLNAGANPSQILNSVECSVHEDSTLLHQAAWWSSSSPYGPMYCPQFIEEIAKREGKTKEFERRFSTAWFDSNSQEKSAEMVTALLNSGVHPDAQDKRGLTPLHLAAWRGNAKVVDALLEAGADPNSKDINGDTPLHYSVVSLDWFLNTFERFPEWNPNVNEAEKNSAEVVTILLAAGASPDPVDNLDMTPLDFAIDTETDGYFIPEYPEIVQVLLAGGANPNRVRLVDAGTPLMTAVSSSGPRQQLLRQRGYYSRVMNIIQLLLSAGSNLQKQDKYGDTALHRAVEVGNIDAVRMMIVDMVGKSDIDSPLDILNAARESATAMARKLAGLPARRQQPLPEATPIDTVSEYTASSQCGERQKTPMNGIILISYVDGYKDKSGNCVILRDAIRKRNGKYVSKGALYRAERQWNLKIQEIEAAQSKKPPQYPTSPEIYRLLIKAGGSDWTENYMLEWQEDREKREKAELSLEQARLSLQQTRYSFRERVSADRIRKMESRERRAQAKQEHEIVRTRADNERKTCESQCEETYGRGSTCTLLAGELPGRYPPLDQMHHCNVQNLQCMQKCASMAANHISRFTGQFPRGVNTE